MRIKIIAGHIVLNLGLKRHCILNESNCTSHQEAVSVFSESRESALCPGTEHRELLSAAKLPSDIAAAVPKADICPPLTFLPQRIRPQTYIAA